MTESEALCPAGQDKTGFESETKSIVKLKSPFHDPVNPVLTKNRNSPMMSPVWSIVQVMEEAILKMPVLDTASISGWTLLYGLT